MLQAWSRLCQERLRPDQPFELHAQLYAAVYAAWKSQLYGPAPVWVPQQQDKCSTNIAKFMTDLEVGQYLERYLHKQRAMLGQQCLACCCSAFKGMCVVRSVCRVYVERTTDGGKV